MRLSDFFASLTDEFDRTDDGDLIVRIDSQMLPGVNVDTYQCFSGDSWLDCELDYLATEGVPSWLVDHPAAQRVNVEVDYDDFDWDYDHRSILHALSETAADDLVGAGGIDFPQIITGYEILSTFSPAAYNFATDSFNADWHVDTEELIAALDDIDTEELEEWARDRWASRSGFSSNIPRYFDRDHEWAMVWAAVARVLIDSEYDGFMAVAEAEDEAYSENVTMTPNHRFFEKVYRAVTGNAELPEGKDGLEVDCESEEDLIALLPPVQDEELPIAI